ncbi:hypothetical protein D0T25_29280 [Duganella sp. BJB488]|uniref:hypothetical protein n=1 Tax=unclassified Duganella TaxID=2636909 RepID=UPI000E3413FF|nr:MULTISPECIES: hypothetical protein [unclassified Duganella]RFP09715.1 hypothetical protein D0T26_28855 [Duganella sp. BJB489]RFP13424.1 hypothetical protein D0T25_29280 [Duganella sp. BJB488]RFP29284.1 hypothetical protein D0T24_29385 [Duganella sp. BJB480]
MNMTRNSTIALLILALAGCAAERSGEPSGSSGTSGNTPSGTSSYTPSSSSPGSQSNQSSTTGTMTSSGMAGSGATASSSSQSAQTSYGVVQAIDQMQRQDVGVGAVGAAAAGGSVGMPTDKVYRVTVRLDDGSNQMVVVDSMPSYKIGDRVRYSNGTLSSY